MMQDTYDPDMRLPSGLVSENRSVPTYNVRQAVIEEETVVDRILRQLGLRKVSETKGE
jgi:hypothetical protein